MNLSQANNALELLREAGCKRVSGMWITPEGRGLDPDPVVAARLLRRLSVAKAIEQQRASGRPFTR